MNIRALSGRPVGDITIQTATAGELASSDTRIHPDTLIAQAEVAARHGNPELAENLRRAAELALLPDAEILSVYAALRPGRSSRQELERIVARLDEAGASRCAALIRDAAQAYELRGLLRQC
jgi:propanediol dehydratase small subunit